MLDESATYPDWEVYWDCDSPTPSAWRNLQAPKLSDDELLCSPQLPKTKKRKPASTTSLTSNRPGCEQSRNEVYQIINALRRASREGCESESNVGCVGKLVIPDIPEEEESEDEKQSAPVPSFRASRQTNTNTSIDQIFDMSGSGEDLAPTATNAKTQYPSGSRPQTLPIRGSNAKFLPKPVSPNVSDAWTDDDLFSDDILMSQIEKGSSGTTPAKLVTKPKNESTPLQKLPPKARPTTTTNKVGCTSGDRRRDTKNTAAANAKGFLDFFMDSGAPAKPSPEKQNSNVLKKNNHKFSKNTESHKTQSCSKNRPDSSSRKVLPMDRNDSNCAMVLEKTKEKHAETAKSMDTSIPLDILEELIMEDSWTEGEETTPQKQSISTKPKAFSDRTTTCLDRTNFTYNTNKRTNAQPMPSGECTNRLSLKRSHTMPVQTKNPPVQSKMVQSERFKDCRNNPISNKADEDGFLSDDEEFLLEAVALSESQQSAKGKFFDVVTSALSESRQSAKGAAKLVQTRKTTSRETSSQAKCSRSEIEMKKRMAMERRMKNMRNQRSSRT